jgi:hypothetical protein
LPLIPVPWTVCSTNMTMGRIKVLQKNHTHTDIQKFFAAVTLKVDGELLSSTNDRKRYHESSNRR